MQPIKYGLFFISKEASTPLQHKIYMCAKTNSFRGNNMCATYEVVPYTGSLNADSAVTDIFELKSRISTDFQEEIDNYTMKIMTFAEADKLLKQSNLRG